jgi:DNA mismatch repair protein MutL
MPIHVLPPAVADKIAAGEVIERPASVAKELVENSIDAGATDIQVTIREGGRRLIRVVDNGCGIPEAELELALARHATSKLHTVDDLEAIRTLGFRGEALTSIAAVSQMTIASRPRNQPVGRTLRIEGGQIVRRQGRGAPVGTSVSVENLFYNVPARLKFLRQPATETGHIHRVVVHYAMAHAHIRFRLEVDGRLTFHSSGSGQLHDVLVAVYGLDVAQQMLPVGAEAATSPEPAQTDLQVTGFVGQPSLHRANRNYITLFVNQRWIQDRSLSHAVAQAYHTLLPVGRHPVAVIQIEVDSAQVDVNVHPTKREVRFRDGRRVFAAVQSTVRAALLEQAPMPVASHPGSRDWPTPSPWRAEQTPRRADAQAALDLYRPDEPEPVGPVRLPLLRVVGQIGQTYIVAEGPQGMYLIDQHAAHERVLYEDLLAQAAAGSVTAQTLLEPASLDLLPSQEGALAEHLEALRTVGFDVEPFGGTTYLLRAVPTLLDGADPVQALVDVLDDLPEESMTHAPLEGASESKLIAAVCKRAAVKAGQTLSLAEMQALVRGLEQCDSPRTCPHGRPTVVHFSAQQLEREFLRR